MQEMRAAAFSETEWNKVSCAFFGGYNYDVFFAPLYLIATE